jgi:hypothetical protein
MPMVMIVFTRRPSTPAPLRCLPGSNSSMVGLPVLVRVKRDPSRDPTLSQSADQWSI